MQKHEKNMEVIKFEQYSDIGAKRNPVKTFPSGTRTHDLYIQRPITNPLDQQLQMSLYTVGSTDLFDSSIN